MKKHSGMTSPLQYRTDTNPATQALTGILLQSCESAIIASQYLGVMAPDEWLHALATPAPKNENARLVVLTLSAYRFQGLMCVMSIGDVESLQDDDHLKELANNICGTFKRYLGRYVGALGMSTPDLLPPDCLKYFGVSHTRNEHPPAVHSVDSDGVRYYITLLMQGDIDLESYTFAAAVNPTDHSSPVDTTGELELFL
jgi:hypothetical protein